MAWRFSTADRNGPYLWDCVAISQAGHLDSIIDHLRHVESLSLSDLGQQGSHAIQLDKLSPNAIGRLREIKLDDIDELYSMRVTGKGRLWCIQDQNIMRVLWWDPNHEVCPSQKKGT